MLKKIFVLLFIAPFFSSAQNFKSTLVFSAEQGDAFFVYLNGEKKNAAAQANVTVHGLDQPYYDVRIEFLNSTISPIERKNVAAADSDDKPMQVTYKVRKDKSGKARLSFYAMLPPVSTVGSVASTTEQKTAPVKEKPDTGVTKTLLSNVSGATISFPGKEDVKLVKDTLVRAEKTSPEKVEPLVKKTVVKPVVSAAKTPSVTAAKKELPVKTNEVNKDQTVSNLPPLKKCNDWPLMKEEFQKIKEQINGTKDEAGKLSKAKSLSEANCLLVSQLGEIASVFISDTNKLGFIMHAYSATIDRPNFERLRKLFTDPAVIKNFDKFLQSR